MINNSFTRFILVGIFNTLLGYALLLFLFHILDMSYSWAYFLSYMIGFVVSYFLTRAFVFRSQKKKRIEFIKFVLAFGIAYGCSYLVLHLLMEHKVLSPNLSFLMSMGVYSICFYLLNRSITFNKERL